MLKKSLRSGVINESLCNLRGPITMELMNDRVCQIYEVPLTTSVCTLSVYKFSIQGFDPCSLEVEYYGL